MDTENLKYEMLLSDESRYSFDDTSDTEPLRSTGDLFSEPTSWKGRVLKIVLIAISIVYVAGSFFLLVTTSRYEVFRASVPESPYCKDI